MSISSELENGTKHARLIGRIWKHGVAVSVESKLDDRNTLGKQLFEVGRFLISGGQEVTDGQLGDSSKSLHDEMRKIDSMTVTTFGNLHLEVCRTLYPYPHS